MIVTFNLENLVNDLENCYIKLDPKFTKKLFLSMSKNPSVDKELAKILGLKIYHDGRTPISVWYSGRSYMPLKIIQQIVKNSNYKWEKIEKHMIGIKARRKGRTKLVRPNFPIRLDRNLGVIVGHIIGDGAISSRDLQPFYSNSNKVLLREFQEAMKFTFGVDARIWVQKPGKFKKSSKWIKRIYDIDELEDNYSCGLFYPKIVGLILHAIFGQFVIGHYKKIPKISFDVPSEFKSGLIRAFFDDEASVDYESHTIRAFQDKKEILEDIKKLLLDLSVESGEVHSYWKGGKERYYFDICGYENFCKFQKFINFSTPEKKHNLRKLIERIKNSKTFHLRNGQTKSLILEFLKSGSLTTPQIREKLLVKYSYLKWSDSMRLHLHQLQQLGNVSKKKIGRVYLWNLK